MLGVQSSILIGLRDPNPSGVYSTTIGGGYNSVSTISTIELQSYEPLSFSILPLGENYIKVQMRCGNPHLREYYFALLSETKRYWGDKLKSGKVYARRKRRIPLKWIAVRLFFLGSIPGMVFCWVLPISENWMYGAVTLSSAIFSGLLGLVVLGRWDDRK